jgi:hypothetical protein
MLALRSVPRPLGLTFRVRRALTRGYNQYSPFGLGPYWLSPRWLSKHIKTRKMSPPTYGMRLINQNHLLFPLSCKRRT